MEFLNKELRKESKVDGSLPGALSWRVLRSNRSGVSKRSISRVRNTSRLINQVKVRDTMYHFEAFSNKLTDLLRGLPALDEDMIKSFVLTELEPVCTHDEFSFLYTQLVLKNLSLSHENGKLSLYRLRRIAYELDQYLSDVEGGKVMSEALVCSKGLSQELSVAIINIISAKNAKPSAADLIRVRARLCFQKDSTNAA